MSQTSDRVWALAARARIAAFPSGRVKPGRRPWPGRGSAGTMDGMRMLDQRDRIGAARRRGRSSAVRSLAVDALVALATLAVAIAALLASDEPAARSPDALAYALLILAAAPLAARRRAPVAVIAATSALSLISLAMDYPGGAGTAALLVALYSIASAGHRWWTLGVTVFFAGGGLVFRALVENDSPVVIALDSALFVLVSLLGDTVHSRRALRAEVQERLRAAAVERELEARRRAVEERMRIARELHDVMAHTVTTMTVQAGVAADVLGDGPDDARDALQAIRAAGRDAMAELRATISVLREEAEQAPLPPAPGLSQLGELVGTAEQAGLRVRLNVSGGPRALPPATDVTAFRIVQEALTNVVRHADATQATISIRHDPVAVVIEVDDDGRGPDGLPTAGYGLVGMQERAEAVGGQVQVGQRPGGGFRVRARLPTAEAKA
jgi:signal transduction histidine kinase